MPVKAVFFDMGETLCYQSPSTPQILSEFLVERGIDVGPNQPRLAYLAAMTFFSRWAMRVDVTERTPERREEMIAGFYQVMMQALGLENQVALIPELRATVLGRRSRPFNALFEDVFPALEALRARGLRLGIISNWDDTLTDTVHDLGLTRYLETVVASANVGVEKPNAGIFQHALARLGLGSAEACHVGDIYYMDVLGARAAGLTPVLIDRYRLQTSFDCLRVDSLTELPTILDEVNP